MPVSMHDRVVVRKGKTLPLSAAANTQSGRAGVDMAGARGTVCGDPQVSPLDGKETVPVCLDKAGNTQFIDVPLENLRAANPARAMFAGIGEGVRRAAGVTRYVMQRGRLVRKQAKRA